MALGLDRNAWGNNDFRWPSPNCFGRLLSAGRLKYRRLANGLEPGDANLFGYLSHNRNKSMEVTASRVPFGSDTHSSNDASPVRILMLRYQIRDSRFEIPSFNLKSQISNLKSQISNLKSQISNLKSQISNLKSQISNLKSQISNLKSQISNLKSQISNLKSQISNLKSQISNLKSQISNLKSQISGDHGKIIRPLNRRPKALEASRRGRGGPIIRGE